MKKVHPLPILSKLFAIIFLISASIACSNAASDDHEEHNEAEGFRLISSGQTIVEQLPDQQVTGQISLNAGSETALLSIYFIDHDGAEFQPDEASYTLGYEFSETGIAEFVQHTEDGKWNFHIKALKADTTQLNLMLLHSGHSDFQSLDIPVHIQTAE